LDAASSGDDEVDDGGGAPDFECGHGAWYRVGCHMLREVRRPFAAARNIRGGCRLLRDGDHDDGGTRGRRVLFANDGRKQNRSL
jgi:hypothetical protein